MLNSGPISLSIASQAEDALPKRYVRDRQQRSKADVLSTGYSRKAVFAPCSASGSKGAAVRPRVHS
jgi:hypothetical protein